MPLPESTIVQDIRRAEADELRDIAEDIDSLFAALAGQVIDLSPALQKALCDLLDAVETELRELDAAAEGVVRR